MAKKQDEIWYVLGGVRFFLAFIVVCRHLDYLKLRPGFISQIADLCALSAVLGFLAISGFSIAHSIANRRDQFYRRRFLRIYPLYALAVLSSLPWDAMNRNLNFSRTPKVIVGNLAFLETFRFPVVYGNPVLWSVAVEVALYGLTPLLARLKNSVLLGLIAISAFAFVILPHLNLAYFAWQLHGEALLFLAWAWLAGFVYYRVRDRQHAGLLLLCGMIIVTTLNETFTFRFHEITLALTMYCLTCGGSWSLAHLTRKILQYLGDVSYPLYLFHAPIMFLYVDKFHHRNPSILILICLAFATVMAAADARLRKPFARLLDRILQSATRTLTALKIWPIKPIFTDKSGSVSMD